MNGFLVLYAAEKRIVIDAHSPCFGQKWGFLLGDGEYLALTKASV